MQTQKLKYTFVQINMKQVLYLSYLVFRWHNILSDGCDDISDCKRSARPKIVTENVMKSVREIMSENCKRIQK